MRVLAVALLVAWMPAPLAAEEETPTALAWHHEGFAAISRAANDAKSRGKRLLLGLSGGST